MSAAMERPIELWTFEETMAALEGVVARIESDELPLEEALALFEQGTRLAQHCGELLDHAELRVTELSQGPGAAAEPAQQ
jgi:exodeoxyribonuclease VII small subunit